MKVRDVKCFIPEFNDWLMAEGFGSFPVRNGAKFPEYLKTWLLTTEGKKWKTYVGFIDDKLMWARVRVVTDQSRKGASADVLKVMYAFDTVMEHKNKATDDETLKVWACSLSF